MRYFLFILSGWLIVITSRGQNLISNSDFEFNGQLDCASWYDACHQELLYLCDTLIPATPCDVQFHKDAPVTGGVWSIAVTGIGNGPASTASTYITGQSGTNQYLLNAWMKDAGNGWGGINIGTHKKGKYDLHKTVRADSSNWAFFSTLDTLTLESTDSIEITLWAFAAGPAFGDINFDQVKLFLTDSLSAIPVTETSSPRIQVYPNPASQYITFDLGADFKHYQVSIYNT
ncbi:MAG TPA: hypothetical protein VJ508_12560, partial [Saprospiraceae bacterium]|nr:hypothetical protein [Saprospiraceae bacterium]